MKGYSQNKEDEVFVPLLVEMIAAEQRIYGVLLDIGANDGLTFSNSYVLLRRGWGGVLVDCDARSHLALCNRYNGNPLVEVVYAAVVASSCREEKVLVAQADDSMLTTITGDALQLQKSVWRDQGFVEEERVRALTPRALLSFATRADGPHPSPTRDVYDFISIDVEKMNREIFDEMPWDQLTRCKCVCVEHDGHDVYMERTLRALGYEGLLRNAENLVMVRRHLWGIL